VNSTGSPSEFAAPSTMARTVTTSLVLRAVRWMDSCRRLGAGLAGWKVWERIGEERRLTWRRPLLLQNWDWRLEEGVAKRRGEHGLKERVWHTRGGKEESKNDKL